MSVLDKFFYSFSSEPLLSRCLSTSQHYSRAPCCSFSRPCAALRVAPLLVHCCCCVLLDSK
ncbi:hypothetical protein ACOSP7_024092 [Xanthoceras sorbifolium]